MAGVDRRRSGPNGAGGIITINHNPLGPTIASEKEGSSMSGRYWYQDGWLVLTVVGVVGFFGYGCYVNAARDAGDYAVTLGAGVETPVWVTQPGNQRVASASRRLAQCPALRLRECGPGAGSGAVDETGT
jgi:hypothetical protein